LVSIDQSINQSYLFVKDTENQFLKNNALFYCMFVVSPGPIQHISHGKPYAYGTM